MATYLSNKCPKKNEALQKAVKKILSLSTDKHVGWVVSERFINMPVEIMAPMYNMLQEELKRAVSEVSDREGHQNVHPINALITTYNIERPL